MTTSARVDAEAWLLVWSLVSGREMVLACYNQRAADRVIDRAVEISGGFLTREDLAPHVRVGGWAS